VYFGHHRILFYFFKIAETSFIASHYIHDFNGSKHYVAHTPCQSLQALYRWWWNPVTYITFLCSITWFLFHFPSLNQTWEKMYRYYLWVEFLVDYETKKSRCLYIKHLCQILNKSPSKKTRKQKVIFLPSFLLLMNLKMRCTLSKRVLV
jgi:hypothetical protein